MRLINRRDLLALTGVAAFGGVASSVASAGQGNFKSPAWGFFNVRDYGTVGNGKVLDTAAINRAIEECHNAGGGMVYVPPGTYLCGTVVLKSNVTLYLEAGSTLLGSKTLADYSSLPERSSQTEAQGGGSALKLDLKDTGKRHLVFAQDAENITLAGPGRLDGQGPSFWIPRSRKPAKAEDAWQDVVTWYWEPLARPSPMLEFYNCKNLRLETIRIENAPGWTLRPVQCENVFIHGVTIKNPIFGVNTDGIDLMGCRNVFISDCVIDTGDDAICLKSENPYGGDIPVSKNIMITNCVLTSCCNGLKFGTATFGRFENITFSNSVIFSEEAPLNQRVISGIALEMVDGGALEGVVIANIKMQRVRSPIFIRRGARHSGANGEPGKLCGVMMENIHATNSILTSSITGLEGFDVEDVTLSNIRIDSDEAGKAEWAGRAIPEAPKAYPEARMFGRFPSYGLYCRHVKGLRLRQVEFKAASGEERPAIVCDDVKDLEISGLRSAPIIGVHPVIKLVQSKQVFIRDCVAPADTNLFLEVQGDKTERVVMMGNNLVAAKKIMQLHGEVAEKAVTAVGNAGS